jgi:hypothetical protein
MRLLGGGRGLVLLLALGLSQAARADSLLDAAARGDRPSVERLLAAGASTDGRNAAGETPLLLAVRAGARGAVEALLQAHAGVDLAAHSGRTPLIEAAARGDDVLVARLLDAGARTSGRDRLLGTALDAAQSKAHPKTAELLVARGARGSGKSPGDLVCVRPWPGGEGFCGRIGASRGGSLEIDVTRLVGCAGGCEARPDCSQGENVGPSGLGPGSRVVVPRACLTSTGEREP